ncbi:MULTISPECIES: MCE family protein [unclassified Nocardioides]|uniref:MCE family protein n=1 Tax=unclassified Nocardioides TaxID=2615069 RepID=UPI000056FA52|nr:MULTISPECIES: MCE family protein [unclassified Nocardioides]ABL80231.1 virulence factor Mce family protein [Nocardioides sp. JS614]
MSSILKRAVVPAVLVILLVAAALTMFRGEDHKTLTAHFPRAISIYEGSDVRVLGVPVGKVDTVTPSGTDVVVTMTYDADLKLPADAKAVIIAPSIVGDRFVQLTPVYTGGDVLADGATLAGDRTAVPLELDQIYSSLDDLTVALGPTGANRNGAFSDLLETTAENFGGQGAKFHQTIQDFGKLSQTLDDNKEELFGSAQELEGFIGTLARNDKTVRKFNDSLSQVSTMLSGERQELSASLQHLATALGQVSDFVKENREVLGSNISGLNRVSKVLVKRRSELDGILDSGPLALNNLALTYNPQAGTLDTNANLGEVFNQVESDPSTFLCGFLSQADTSGALCDLVQQALPRPGTGAPGAPRSSVDLFDPTLAGLVGVAR